MQAICAGSVESSAVARPVQDTAYETLDAAQQIGQQGEPSWEVIAASTYLTMSMSLFRFLRANGLSEDMAEDVVQEAFCRLARQLSLGQRFEKLEAWLFQVAYNLSIDHHRAAQRWFPEMPAAHGVEKIQVDLRTNPEWVFLQKERATQVQTAMSHLTARQYRSIQLRAYGMRYRDIAADLGVTEQRAVDLVKRARLRIESLCTSGQRR